MIAAARNSGNMTAICWGLVYLALAGVIGLESGVHRQVAVPTPLPAARADNSLQPRFSLLPLQQGFAETTARSIFVPSRRSSISAVQAMPAMQPGQFILLGSLITPDKRIAMLREVATGKVMRVEQGKEIRGIMVASVYPEKVILTQGDGTEELALKIQPPARLPPGAAPRQTEQPRPPAPQAVISIPSGGAQPNTTPGAAAPADGGGETQLQINQRRAMRGLPPI